MTWTDLGVLLCNVIEGLALAVILLVVGYLILSGPPMGSDDKNGDPQ